MRTARSIKQHGFSLLELLVAFAIMAMSLGLIYKSMGTSARNVGDLASHQYASMLANTLLNTKDSVTDQGWNESGGHGPFTWQISSQPFQSSANAIGLFNLHEIQITISWPNGESPKQLTARTLLPQRKPLPGEVVR
jgi:general secretion pathway protein I